MSTNLSLEVVPYEATTKYQTLRSNDEIPNLLTKHV